MQTTRHPTKGGDTRPRPEIFRDRGATPFSRFDFELIKFQVSVFLKA